MESNMIKTMLEDALNDYFLVNTWFNRIFDKELVLEAKKSMFKRYQMACSQLDLCVDRDLKKLVEEVEELL